VARGSPAKAAGFSVGGAPPPAIAGAGGPSTVGGAAAGLRAAVAAGPF